MVDCALDTAESESPLLASLLPSYQRHLRAENRTQATIRTYGSALAALVRFLQAQGMLEAVVAIRREHLEAFFADLLTRRTPKTASTYFVALAVFWKWAVEDGELRASPMARMQAPHVPEQPPPVLSDDQVRRLLRNCEGTSFEQRRDAAILTVLLDTGIRRGELLGLTAQAIDWERGAFEVLGKGRKRRICAFGVRTARALDRYLRARERHPHHERPELWLRRQGALSAGSLELMLKRRGRAVGLANLYPHLFRHYFADAFLRSGGEERDLLTLGGWTSPTVARRYAASNAVTRAHAAHKKHGPGDRL